MNQKELDPDGAVEKTGRANERIQGSTHGVDNPDANPIDVVADATKDATDEEARRLVEEARARAADERDFGRK